MAPLWGVICVCILLHFVSPFAERQLIPACPSYSLTGTLCPGCGTLRALYCITHGEVWLGLRFNPIIALALPMVVVLVFRPRIGRSRVVAWAALSIICAYWILRNFLPCLAQPDMDDARRRLRPVPVTVDRMTRSGLPESLHLSCRNRF